jgi:hypothetical protein
MRTPRTRRSRLLAGIGAGGAVVAAAAISISQLGASTPSALQKRIELLLYRPDAPEAILPAGGDSSPVIALTALRALRQVGDDTPVPASFASVVGAGLGSVPPTDALYSFQSLSDLVDLQGRGDVSTIRVPADVRDSVQTVIASDLSAGAEPDPQIASDRLVRIRAARDIGIPAAFAPDAVSAWCHLADQAVAASRLDVAAVFAEMAGSDPRTCAADVDVAAWSAAVARAADRGEVIGLTFLARGWLSDDQAQRLAARVLAAMDEPAARGTLSFRTIEVATRLVRRPVDQASVPRLLGHLRRQVLLVGSVADQVAIGDWDRIATAGVLSLSGTPAPTNRESELQPSAVGASQPGLASILALHRDGTLRLPPSTDSTIADAANVPGLVTAVTVRTGDCAYARERRGATPFDRPDARSLVGLALDARAAGRCGGADQALWMSALDAASRTIRTAVSGGPPDATTMADLWAALETDCLLDRVEPGSTWSAARQVSESYLAAVTGSDPFPVYSATGLYAALRVRQLAERGCDGQGWWTGAYAPR